MKSRRRPSGSNARDDHPCSEDEKDTVPDKLSLTGILIAVRPK